MRLLALLLSLSLLNANAAFFKKSSKTTTSPGENYLSEFTHVEKLFASSSNKYPLRADIIIPAAGDEFQLMLHYDELTDMPIKDIAWISGRKAQAIAPLRSESNINTQLEKMVNRSNPGIAYDRMQTNKHVISKTYYFKKSKVFPSKKPEPQSIKITWANNAVIYATIDNLYLTKSEPSASPKARPTKMGAAPSPSPQGSDGRRVPRDLKDMENEQVKQQKQYEYEMLEIESTLRQMKNSDSDEESGSEEMQQFMPGALPSSDEVPQLPEF